MAVDYNHPERTTMMVVPAHEESTGRVVLKTRTFQYGLSLKIVCLIALNLLLGFELSPAASNCDPGTKSVSDSSQPTVSVWHSRLLVPGKNAYTPARVNGFALPDFSRAGYHGGDRDIPRVVVRKTVGAMPGDATLRLQAALNAARGGALLLLPGTYRISSGLVVPAHTVLRGSGTEKTFIVMAAEDTTKTAAITGNRSKSSLPGLIPWVLRKGDRRYDIVGDVSSESVYLPLRAAYGLSDGDFAVIKNEVTDRFRSEYNPGFRSGGRQVWPSDQSALKYLRRIVQVTAHGVRIDAPLGHPLSVADAPHIIKTGYMAREIGVEDLSIGFMTPPQADMYRKTSAKGQRASFHAASAITFGNVVNGWIRNVKSFPPAGTGPHLHSRGIVLTYCRHVTVANCDMGFPANIGHGGNGYLYVLSAANDCLVQDTKATQGRHNFLFHWSSSGNVLSGCTSVGSYLANDFHHSLAHSNLIENMTIVNSSNYYAFENKNRGGASMGAGRTGTNNVFWKIKVISKHSSKRVSKILSEQTGGFGGRGYLIGVTDAAGTHETVGGEWREGIGREDSLRPVSLYQAQRAIRLSNASSRRRAEPEKK